MEVKETKYLGVKIDPDAFYTTREAMEILDIKSQTTIIAKVATGELKRFKQGRKIHYVGRDLLDYLHRGEA